MDALNNISLVVACDNHYAILLAALLKSIEQNHKSGERIEVYVLDDGISEKNQERINSMLDREMFTLHWLKTKAIIPDDVSIPIDKTAFPFTTYYRLFAPQAISERVKKVIYLDVDMIVLDDISKLWNTDIGEYLFAAVQDYQLTVDCSWGGIPNYKALGIPGSTKYFNAGLLVINTQKWRDQNVTRRILTFMHENINHINFADQYGLNAVLYDQWFQLDPTWNWFANFEREDPAIIHFIDIKPTFKSYQSVPLFKDLFYKYLRLSPWWDHKPVSHYNRLFKKLLTKVNKFKLRIQKA